MRCLWCFLIVGLLALPAWAIPVVDGTKDAEYGAALAVQTVDTGFGNNESEWNAGYAKCCDDGRLYVMLTGNLQDNFNKFEIFLDSKAGGQNVFASAGNDGSSNMNGMVFDNGFTADYYITVRRGNDQGNDKFDIDFANLGAGTFSSYSDVLGGSVGSGTTGTGVNANSILVGFNNSNVAGVGGNCPMGQGCVAADPTAAAAVTTGLELGISLSDLGYTSGGIRIMAGQNNQDHNYWSNQILSGLPVGLMNGVTPGTGNLGGDNNGGFNGTGAVNFASIAGNQYFTACPEPSTLALFGLALVGVAGSRRRSQ